MPNDKREELQARDVDLSSRSSSKSVPIVWSLELKSHTRKGYSLAFRLANKRI